MGSVLATLTAIVVAILTAALAVPYFIDWNHYRDVFETQATKVFGRAVKIDGDIDLKILPTPFIKMRGLRVADELGSFQRPFAEAERFDMYLSLTSLLSGTVETKRLELDQPVVRVFVDELGEGNWQGIGPRGFNLPVRQFLLDEVDIKDGMFEFRRGHSSPPSRIDRISGTLVADGLTGPFRFTGTSAIAGDRREIRLATGKVEKLGFHLKGSIRATTGASIYHLDGNVGGLDGALKYSGPVIARLALDKAAREATANGTTDAMPGKVVELRASSAITLENMKLENIAFTLTQDDRPQSLSGSAFASWIDKPRLDIAVDATWLDVDQLLRITNADKAAGKADKQDSVPSATSPAMAVAALPHLFTGWSFAPQEGVVKAKIQQAALGGEMIEGLNFEASHGAGGWKVDKLVAKLPGDTDISVSGTLQPSKKLALAGDFGLSGKNLPRLLRWAAPSLGAVDAGDAPRFSLNGGVTLGSDKIAFKNAKGQLGDSTFSGNLIYDFGEASQLQLSLDSERLDLRRVFGGRDPMAPAPNEPGTWTAKTENAAPAKASLADVAASVFKARSSQVSVRIAHLQMPSLEARDVRSELRYEGGTIDIRELNLATTDGLSVRADGRITDFDKKPNGALNLAVNAPTSQSVANLARLAGLDSFGAVARRRVEALAPLKVTGSLEANRQSRELQLTFAGNAAGSELSLSGKLDGDFSDLNDAKLNLTGVIGNADGRRLIAQLAPEVPLDDTTAVAGPGALNVTASGAMKTGLTTRLDLRTPDATGRFDGRVAPLATPWSFEGDLSLRASQASTALSMLRISPGGAPVTGALELQASISKRAMKYEVGNLDLRIGGEIIGGSVKVDVSGAQPVAEVDIGAGAVVLPKLAAYLVDWDRKDLTSQIAEATGGQTIWANQAFSVRVLEAVGGTLKLKASSLALTDDLLLSEALLQANLKDGALTVTALDGQLYGGTFSGGGTLKSERGRLTLDARVSLEKADMAKIVTGSDGKPLVKGKGDLELTLEGEGLSPRGLIAVTNGKGQLRMQKSTLAGLSPVALRDAADTYLAENIPQKDKLARRLATDLRKGSLSFGPITLPLVVKDGVVQIHEANFDGPDYVAKVGAMIDLASLRLDSEWEIAYTGKTKSGEKLPPVRFVFAGPVAAIGKLTPQVSQEQYERFLSMRRMELDMERLEKLGQRPGGPRTEGKIKPRPDSSQAVAPTHSIPQTPPEQTGATSPENNWSTGTEPLPTPRTQTEQSAQDPKEFEARIRKALRSQQQQGTGERGDGLGQEDTAGMRYGPQDYPREGSMLDGRDAVTPNAR